METDEIRPELDPGSADEPEASVTVGSHGRAAKKLRRNHSPVSSSSLGSVMDVGPPQG